MCYNLNMINQTKKIFIETQKQFEMIDITHHVKKAVEETKMTHGIVSIFCPHTTAAVRLNENEPLLVQDIMKTLYKLVPIDASYSHDLFEVRSNLSPSERSNGHAHLKSFLLGASETLPVEKSQVIIGHKQSIFFVELDGGRSREVYVKVLGEWWRKF